MRYIKYLVFLSSLVMSANIKGEAYFIKKNIFQSNKIYVCQGRNIYLIKKEFYKKYSNLELVISLYNFKIAQYSLAPSKEKLELINESFEDISKGIKNIRNDTKVKVENCGIKGNFYFNNIAKGEYIIFSTIAYRIDGINTYEFLSKEININNDNSDFNIILSGNK